MCPALASYYTSLSAQRNDVYSEFSGANCMEQLCDSIDVLAHAIHERNETAMRVPAYRTVLEEQRYDSATKCEWCEHTFDSEKFKKCFDHDHLTGHYRSAACNQCNLRLRQKRNTLVVVFHNFRGYDSHSLCLQGLVSKPDWDVHTIAQNPEKYLALTASLRIGKSSFKVRFIDSLQFLNAGLATLVTNLSEDTSVNKLVHATKMRDTYPELRHQDISAKGLFPYTFLDSMEKLGHPDLPPLADWYDVLDERISITEEDLDERARDVASIRVQEFGGILVALSRVRLSIVS